MFKRPVDDTVSIGLLFITLSKRPDLITVSK